MTTLNREAEREEFERQYSGFYLKRGTDDRYTNYDVQIRWEAWQARASLPPASQEHDNAREIAMAALQTIIDYPMSDPKNMDAANMKLIAIRAMTTQPTSSQPSAPHPAQSEEYAKAFDDMALSGTGAFMVTHIPHAELSSQPLAAPEQRQCKRCGEVNPAEIHTCTPIAEQPAGGTVTDEEILAHAKKYCVFDGDAQEYDPRRYELTEDFINMVRSLLQSAERGKDAEDARRFEFLLEHCNIGYDESEKIQLVIEEPMTSEDWRQNVRDLIDAAMSAKGGGEL